jgi:putative CocE/NonD family hydrolase
MICLVLAAFMAAGTAAPPLAAAAKKKGTKLSSKVKTKGSYFDYRKIKGLSKPKFSHDDIVRESFEVPMSTPDPNVPGEVNLYVEVVRPKKMAKNPTILELSPYHGTLADRSGARVFPGPKYEGARPAYLDTPEADKTLGLAGYFAPRGYSVVFADLRGTGKSGGCLDHLGPRDLADSKELIDWIAKQPWSNGRVGMTGHSYVGSTPSMAAAENPKALKTIVPSAGLASMYHHKFQMGVPYFLQWVGPAEAYEQLAIERYLLPQLGDEYGDSFGENVEWFGCGAPNSAVVTGDAFASGQYVDWDAERDHEKGAIKSKIPVFAVHGTHDNAARIPALSWFHKRKRSYDKAWIGQWDHGSNLYPNDRTCPQHVGAACQNDQWTVALHAWFDKILAQRKVKTGPKVEIFLNNKTVYQPKRWPPKRKNVKLFLGAEGVLSTTFAEEETSDMYVADAQGENDAFATGNLQYQTEPLKKGVLLAGIPKMLLNASVVSPKRTTHIIPTMYDVPPEGDPIPISKGTFAINPELRDGIETITPVVPAEKMVLKMPGMAQAHYVPKGHRILLLIASSHPDKVATFAEGVATVYEGGAALKSSHVTLPVIKRATVKKDTYVR